MLKFYLTYFIYPVRILICSSILPLLQFHPLFISHDLFLFLFLVILFFTHKITPKHSNKRHSFLLCLQSCRCLNGWDSPAERHRQLCTDGAPGCTAVPGVTAPHRPQAQLSLCGSQYSADSVLAQTQLHVDRLKIFSIFETSLKKRVKVGPFM